MAPRTTKRSLAAAASAAEASPNKVAKVDDLETPGGSSTSNKNKKSKKGAGAAAAAMVSPPMSDYEKARQEKIARNKAMLANLGINQIKAEASAIVDTLASEVAKKRGLKAKAKKAVPPSERPPPRRSGRLTGTLVDGVMYDDPEEAFNAKIASIEAARPPTRLPLEPLPAIPLNAGEEEGDAGLQVLKFVRNLGERGLRGVTRAKPSAQDLANLQVRDTCVAKVVKERAYSLAWHPSPHKHVLVAGDKIGHVGLWVVEGGGDEDGVYLYRPHLGSVPTVQFHPDDINKLYSTSYDGTIRCLDFGAGEAEDISAFDLFYANREEDDIFLTMSHIAPGQSNMLVSDSGGRVTSLDLRTGDVAWMHTLHQKKINSVQVCPGQPHMFATASLDSTVCLWDQRKMGGGKTSSAKLATFQNARSMNSAHFSPNGSWLVTTGQDDKIKVYDVKKPTAPPVCSIYHNNQTGRWLTKFQAVFDPKNDDIIGIGSMNKGPHGLDIYQVPSGAPLCRLNGGDVMTSIQSIVAFHPYINAVAGINSSGRCHVFL